MATLTYHMPNFEEEVFYTNNQNRAFYENLTCKQYDVFAKLSGLQECEDIFAMYPYLQNANSILEVGAGFGRAINAFGCIRPDAEIHALEQCGHMCEYMADQYFCMTNVEIIQGDILDSRNKRLGKYDLVTLLWSTLTAFAPEEQLQCLKKCVNRLTKGGHFVVDLYASSAASNLQFEDGTHQMYITESNGNQHFGAIPSEKELLRMARQAKLCLIESIFYESAGVKRKLYIFS